MIDLNDWRSVFAVLDEQIRDGLARCWELAPHAWECPVCCGTGCGSCHDLGIVPRYVGRRLRDDISGPQSRMHKEPLRLPARDVDPADFLLMRAAHDVTLPGGWAPSDVIAERVGCSRVALYQPSGRAMGHTIESRPITWEDRELLPRLHPNCTHLYRATIDALPSGMGDAIGAWWRLSDLARILDEGRSRLSKIAAEGRTYHGRVLERRPVRPEDNVEDGRVRSLYRLGPIKSGAPARNPNHGAGGPDRDDLPVGELPSPAEHPTPVVGDWFRLPALAAILDVTRETLCIAATGGHLVAGHEIERRPVRPEDNVEDGRVRSLYRIAEAPMGDRVSTSKPIVERWCSATLLAESIGVTGEAVRSAWINQGTVNGWSVPARRPTENPYRGGVLYEYKLVVPEGAEELELELSSPIVGRWVMCSHLAQSMGVSGAHIRTSARRSSRLRYRFLIERREARGELGPGVKWLYRATDTLKEEGEGESWAAE